MNRRYRRSVSIFFLITILTRFHEIHAQQKNQPIQSTPDTTEEHFLNHDGLKLRYIVYVPQEYDHSKPLAVVLNFHGGMGSAENQMKTSDMNRVADRHGFMVVYPDGTGALGRILTFNAGSCCGYAVRKKVDDVGFVKDLIEDLGKQYQIDTSRVYAVGFSNGAMLAYRLAVELSDRIAAIGIVSGDLSVDGPKPKWPVPVIHFHGLKDQNVLWNGGIGPNQIDPHPHRSIPETLEIWKNWNHCAGKPTITESKSDYIMERFEPAEGQSGAPIVIYKLIDGGHQWPGGEEPRLKILNLGKMIHSVDASELMWQFFTSVPARQQ
jgi:polyhydroxybutyrate depolymerase